MRTIALLALFALGCTTPAEPAPTTAPVQHEPAAAAPAPAPDPKPDPGVSVSVELPDGSVKVDTTKKADSTDK